MLFGAVASHGLSAMVDDLRETPFWESGMDQQTLRSTTSHRDQWLALLERQGVGHPRSLHVTEVPCGVVQVTAGEPAGHLCLEGAPANVLMFNLSPVQGLRQTRDGRSSVSDMLHGEMTLMPCGVPSQWSWNSTCDRLDVMVPTDVFGDESALLDVVDRRVFRDSEMETICRCLYKEVSLGDMADRLFVESLVVQLGVLLLRRHSTAPQEAGSISLGGLTRGQARRVLDHIESNLSRDLTLRELAGTANLSPHHFARMFKRTIGTAPHRYVVERRVEHAKRMLRTPGASLVEVGLSMGFCNQSHFTSTFSRVVGVTPTRFIKLHS
jgi:AraC family transcriptional regulator